jgi:hypothetical protein
VRWRVFPTATGVFTTRPRHLAAVAQIRARPRPGIPVSLATFMCPQCPHALDEHRTASAGMICWAEGCKCVLSWARVPEESCTGT